MNKKTCKICGDRFTPNRTFQKYCDHICELIQKTRDDQKAKKKANNKAKKEFNASDRQKLTKDAQTAFNTYIRTRDGKKCISCNYEGEGRQFHAGHYKSQGGNSALRFDELNVHAQCSICNNHLSGNLANYRMALIEKIGIEEVETLETTKNTKRYSIEELQEIIDTYKLKTKVLNAKDNL